MNRDEAIRKVRGLQAVAASVTAPGPERETARRMADQMRARHALTDAELAEPEEELIFFGRKVFFYSQHIRPHLKNIEEEVDIVLALLAKEDSAERARNLTKFERDVRRLIVGVGRRQTIVAARNEAVRALYRQAVEREVEWERKWDGEDADENELYRELRRHEAATRTVKLAVDLRTDTIERIVGVSVARLLERIRKAEAEG